MDFNKIFNDFPLIELDNIRLRALKKSDGSELFAYYSNTKVHQYLDWYGPSTLKKSLEAIEIWDKGYKQGRIIRFAIADIKSDLLLGTIFLTDFEGNRAEIGYELREDAWGKGIMSKAMAAVIKMAFESLDIRRIQAFVSPENKSSIKILEKFDFKEEGLLRQYEYHSVTGEAKDMIIFALLADTEKTGQV